MEYSSIYKKGKVQYFFIATDKPEEWAILQPYYLVTSIDKPRKGNIYEMEKLFNNVWYGRQYHGYGYSSSADVFDTLFDIIEKLYKGKLSECALQELRGINTHDSNAEFSAELLDELKTLNGEYLKKLYE